VALSCKLLFIMNHPGSFDPIAISGSYQGLCSDRMEFIQLPTGSVVFCACFWGQLIPAARLNHPVSLSTISDEMSFSSSPLLSLSLTFLVLYYQQSCGKWHLCGDSLSGAGFILPALVSLIKIYWEHWSKEGAQLSFSNFLCCTSPKGERLICF